MRRIAKSCIILAIMHSTVFCLETCSELEFPEISKNTLHATDGTNVSLHFLLNTKQCWPIPDEFNIYVMQERNGRLLDVCRIRLKGKAAEKQCILGNNLTSCFCTSSDGKMLFFKHVTKDDEGIYVWRWSDKLTKELEKNLTLQVSYAGIKTGEVKSHESMSDPRVVVIISATFCVCLVVMSLVVTMGVVCYKRVQPQNRADMNTSFAYLNDAFQGVNSSRHRARDIYEEIPDPPKKYRRSRVGSAASSKSGVKLPPIPVEQQLEDSATQSLTKEPKLFDNFDGYLHPMPVSDGTLETREFRDKTTV